MFYYNSLLFLLYFTVCFISPSRSGNQQRRFQSFLHEVTVRHCMSPRPVRATSGLSMPMGICSQGPWLTDVTKVRARVVLLLKWVLYPRKQRKLVPIRRPLQRPIEQTVHMVVRLALALSCMHVVTFRLDPSYNAHCSYNVHCE